MAQRQVQLFGNIKIMTEQLIKEARNLILEERKASTSFFQRRMSIKYSEAKELMNIFEAAGVIDEQNGTKPRNILIN